MTGDEFRSRMLSSMPLNRRVQGGGMALTKRAADLRWVEVNEMMREFEAKCAASGHLRPLSGAITQEVTDTLAVPSALWAAFAPKVIHDP